MSGSSSGFQHEERRVLEVHVRLKSAIKTSIKWSSRDNGRQGRTTGHDRRLKLRTDGGPTRGRELGSIDLFVVTFLKMNQLPPNLEHKLPLMRGILDENFFAIRHAFPVS